MKKNYVFQSACALLLSASNCVSAKANWYTYSSTRAAPQYGGPDYRSAVSCSSSDQFFCENRLAISLINYQSQILTSTLHTASTAFEISGADGFGSANLSTGKLHLYVNSGENSGTVIKTQVGWLDTLHFSTNSPFKAQARVHLDGSQYSGYPLTVKMAAYNGYTNMYINGTLASDGDFSSGIFTPSQISQNSGTWLKIGPEDFIADITIDPSFATRVGLELEGIALPGSYINARNTASFSLLLPAGVSFTSDSGSFLQGDASSVPEPATWAMMVAGFGMMGATMRRRHSVSSNLS